MRGRDGENWPPSSPPLARLFDKKHLITHARARGLDKLLGKNR